LDYTLFIKRLTDEALKESDGLTLRDQDLDRVLEVNPKK
jgi:hypothetical protein